MENPSRPLESNGARFTEHLSSSPPYPQYTPDSPEVPEYDVGPTGYMGPSPSNKEQRGSAEAMSPGLESVWDEEGQKEVVPPRPWQQPEPDMVPGILGYRSDDRQMGRTYCGLSKTWFLVVLAAVIIIILGVALGAGLGVGLTKSSSSNSSGSASSPGNTENPKYLIGGAISPTYYTHTDAFNGSGIALASQSFSKDLESGTQGSIVMYFQYHTGEIRYMQLNPYGDWIGGDFSTAVAVDAKNNTPLSAVSYSVKGQNSWHIFYIDKDNTIKQRSNSNTTNVWVNGPINDLNLKANDADQVGMQACWYGSDYGDSDYKHTPIPNQGNNSTFSSQVGMHIWYASDSTTFQQLGWRYGDEVWEHQGEFHSKNGHAGVGCYSWGGGTVTYVMMVNTENTVDFYWRDTNTSLTGTTGHPINEWVKSPAEIENVNPATSLGYTNYFYAQMADNNMINGYNISWAAENTTIQTGSVFTVEGEPGISGTHLSVSAIPNSGGGNNVIVFYQIEGNDITEYTRDLVAGQWSSLAIPIPNK